MGADGAVYSPEESMKPQTPIVPQPTPVTDQRTCWSLVPATVAAKRSRPEVAIVALPGATLTETCGRMVTFVKPLSAPGTWLVAVMVTGFGDGTPAGAR